jgi:hypothetical protein
MRILPLVITSTIAFLFSLPLAVGAGTMLQPTAVTTNMGTAIGNINNVVNQSGLSTNYTSGVTDFATYTASATHNSASGANFWVSASGTPSGNVDFSLGGSFAIDSFALWNLPSGGITNVQGFTLLAANNSSFTGATMLGSFTASISGTQTAAPAQDFSFTTTTASFVRMQIAGNSLGAPFSGFGEAALDVASTAVPEPSTLGMSCIAGLFGMGCWLRRWRRVAG